MMRLARDLGDASVIGYPVHEPTGLLVHCTRHVDDERDEDNVGAAHDLGVFALLAVRVFGSLLCLLHIPSCVLECGVFAGSLPK